MLILSTLGKMHFFIFLLILIKRSEERVSFYKEYSDQDDILSCVNRIVRDHFDSDRQVTILTQGSKDYVKGMESTVRLIGNISKLDKISWFTSETTQQAVVFLDGDFHRDLNVLISLGSFYSHSRILIVCTIEDIKLSGKNYLINVVQHLKQNRISSIAIAIKSNSTNIQLYGYTKTAYGNCGHPKIMSYGRCSDKKSVSRLFPTTVNYNLCSIRLATFDWPPFNEFIIENGRMSSTGIESNVVDIIIERLNASKSFIVAQPSKISDILANNDADIGYGQLGFNRNITSLMYTKSYYSSRGIVLVPTYSLLGNSALNHFLPFKITVWMALIFVAIFVIILRVFIKDFQAIPMLNILAVVIGIGVKQRLKRSSQRTYFMSLILFGYIITQAYVVNLMMIFTKNTDHGQIDSLEELDKSTIPFGGSVTSAKFFKNNYPRLYGRYENMDLTKFKMNLKRLKTGKGGSATYIEATKFVSYKHWENVVILPETITWTPVGMLLPNSSSILKTCDWTITAILEAGLLDEWARLLYYQNLSAHTITEEREGEKEEEDDRRIDLQEFLAILLLPGVGLALSTIVFIIEFLVGFCHKLNQLH